MLRLVVWLAVLVLSAGAAWAQVSEGLATAGKAADKVMDQGGLIGAVAILIALSAAVAIVVMGLVIRALWQTIQGRDLAIAVLQDKRAADAAGSSKLLAEVATTGSATIAANTTAQAEMTSRMRDLVDLVRPMGSEQTRVLANLDRNADKIDDLSKAVGSGCRA